MEVLATSTLLILLGYLLGSIPFGKIIGRQRGIDIQQHGSGNIGFANAVRTLGWKPAIPVLVGDVAKGFAPTYLAAILLPQQPAVAIFAGVAAVAGHIFPIWLKRGGKGIATGLGATLALSPLLALWGLVIYLVVFSWFQKSAPSSLIATWCLPLICHVAGYANLVHLYIVLALLVTWTHRSNIRQILTQQA